jgi:hypothetical protein
MCDCRVESRSRPTALNFTVQFMVLFLVPPGINTHSFFLLSLPPPQGPERVERAKSETWPTPMGSPRTNHWVSHCPRYFITTLNNVPSNLCLAQYSPSETSFPTRHTHIHPTHMCTPSHTRTLIPIPKPLSNSTSVPSWVCRTYRNCADRQTTEDAWLHTLTCTPLAAHSWRHWGYWGQGRGI